MNSLHNDDKTASEKPLPFEVHPAANLFPMMDAKTFAELVEDIREHGVNESIVFWKGKLLDGRNRALALMKLGLDPMNHACDIETEDLDPVSYVLSTNLHRRHLTTSQRAMVAAKCREPFEAEAKKRQGARTDIVENLPPSDKGKSRDKVGEILKVSGKSVDAATKILKGGDDKIIAAVESGEMSLNTAVQIVAPKKEPPTKYPAEHADSEIFAMGKVDVAIAQLKGIPFGNEYRHDALDRVLMWASAQKQIPVAKKPRRGKGGAK